MLGSLRNITEKLERRCSLTEVLIEISVKSYIFLPFCEWGVFFGGVGVNFNSSSDLIINLWNLFSQLLT